MHPEAYANHLIELSREARDGRQTGLQIEFSVIKRSGVAEARNRVARDALAGGFTHVFYLDDDMLVPPGAIRALVAHGLAVVSGLCFLRSPPHHPSMFIDPGVPEGSVVFLRSWPEGDCIEVDAVGCACLLVHVDVFRTLSEQDPSRPYFAFDAARDGEGRVGEDIYFSKRVREAGLRIFVDTARGFGHLGPPVVVDADTVARMDRAGIGGIDYVHVAQAREDAEAVFARSPEAGP